MKKLVYGFAVTSMAICISGGITGCSVLSTVQSTVKNTVSEIQQNVIASSINVEINKQCSEYEKSGDGAGMKAYLLKQQKLTPKPDGWNETTDALIKEWMAKAEKLLAAAQLKKDITTKYNEFAAKGDFDGAKKYLDKSLAAEKKPASWDNSVEVLIKELLVALKKEQIKWCCNAIWQEVKAALDRRDFVTARKLTSTAKPYNDVEIRDAILMYRIGILNEVINPYQCDSIIFDMRSKVANLKNADAIKLYLESVPLVEDDFSNIYNKVKDISTGLKNLYWYDDRIAEYLEAHIAQARELLDTRAVSGTFRDYKEVYDLVDVAVAEMKLYNPNDVSKWEASMKRVQRVMTTAAVNEAITVEKTKLSGNDK